MITHITIYAQIWKKNNGEKNTSNDNCYEYKSPKNDEAFFVLKACNGELLGRSETYSSVSAMENGIESVKKNAPSAELAETAS